MADMSPLGIVQGGMVIAPDTLKNVVVALHKGIYARGKVDLYTETLLYGLPTSLAKPLNRDLGLSFLVPVYNPYVGVGG
jgi:hypothetical protein